MTLTVGTVTVGTNASGNANVNPGGINMTMTMPTPSLASYVQSASANFANSTLTRSRAFNANIQSGNAIIVFVGSTPNASLTVSVSDSLGNTYTQVGGYVTDAGNARVSVWYALNSTGGACTVSVTPSASAALTIGLHEYRGLVAFDTSANATGTNNSPTTGAISTSAQFQFSACGIRDNSFHATNVASPYRLRLGTPVGGAISMGTADHVGDSNGYGGNFTHSGSITWGAITAAFTIF